MSYRDLVSWEADYSPEGETAPEYRVKYRHVPCAIDATRGQETYRGRQLEANTDYVIRLRRDPSVFITSSMRARVVEAIAAEPGAVLNVKAVLPQQREGVAEWWIHCGATP